MDTGSSALQSYTITPRVNGVPQSAQTVSATQLSLIFNGLNNGTTYDFTITARNQTDVGPAVLTNAVLPEPTAPTSSLSGTVSYGGTKTGRVILVLMNQNGGNNNNGGTLAFTSVALSGGSAAFTFSGLQFGNNNGGLNPGNQAQIFAWMDTTGAMHPVGPTDPSGQTSFTVGGDAGVLQITLTDPPPPQAPPMPGFRGVTAGTDFAVINFQKPSGNGPGQLDTATTVEILGSAGNVLKTFVVPPQASDAVLVEQLGQGTYWARLTSSNAGGSSPSLDAGSFVVGPATGGVNLTGAVTVDSSLISSSTGALWIYAFDVSKNGPGGPTGMTRVLHPALQTSNTFTLPNVQPGTYAVGALLDKNGDGLITPGEPGAVLGPWTPYFTVSNATVSVGTIPVTAANSTAVVTTWDNNPMSLRFQLVSGLKVPWLARVVQGPQVTAPVNLGFGGGGPGNSLHFEGQFFLLPFPQETNPILGEPYVFKVDYSDGTSEFLTTTISGVVAAPEPVSPMGSSADAGGSVPTFTWTWSADGGVSSPPYRTGLEVWDNNGFGTVWRTETVSGDLRGLQLRQHRQAEPAHGLELQLAGLRHRRQGQRRLARRQLLAAAERLHLPRAGEPLGRPVAAVRRAASPG